MSIVTDREALRLAWYANLEWAYLPSYQPITLGACLDSDAPNAINFEPHGRSVINLDGAVTKIKTGLDYNICHLLKVRM